MHGGNQHPLILGMWQASLKYCASKGPYAGHKGEADGEEVWGDAENHRERSSGGR